MKGKPYIKVIFISSATLIAFLLLYIFDVRIADSEKYANYISASAVLIVIISFSLLFFTMKSKEFKQWLNSVSEQIENKENQLTKKQIVLIDIFVVVIGMLLVSVRYVQNIMISFGCIDIAKYIKDICFYISVAYRQGDGSIVLTN